MATDNKIETSMLLFMGAERMGLKPAWLTPRGLFAVSTKTGEQYINYSRRALNSHVGVSLSSNKHHTWLVLSRHGLPNIPFMRPTKINDAQVFLATHKKIIVKPVCGSGSRNIRVVDDVNQLDYPDIKNYILEKYIAGPEMRYLILGDVLVKGSGKVLDLLFLCATIVLYKGSRINSDYEHHTDIQNLSNTGRLPQILGRSSLEWQAKMYLLQVV